MKKLIFLFLISFILVISKPISAQIVDGLNDIAVWTFNENIYEAWMVDYAAYVNPQFCKRAWFRYCSTWNIFADPQYNLNTIPPLLNNHGALFEGGVQVSHLCTDGGWPCDNPYDDDHQPPYMIPPIVFNDFVTRNTNNNIYYEPHLADSVICNPSIANENYRDFILYWAYEQIDANVNALEFDYISAGYLFSQNGVPGNNPNTGYDDYAIGTANFANRVSLVCGHGINDPIQWFMPIPGASSEVDSAKYAFDEDPSTCWISETGSNHWIEIDFGRIRTVQQIYLQLHPGHILHNFSIKYWDNEWVDFTPAINITNNVDLTKSFLIESVPTKKIRLFSTDNEVYLPEFQIFGQGFRQFLIKKYCVDSGWTATDSRWETEKLVSFADSSQCPDGTINSFNYRNYLQYHNWSGNPFGNGIITPTNYLDPENPFFLEWFPDHYFTILIEYFFADIGIVNTVEDIYFESYVYQRLYSSFWKSICDSVRNYADQQGKEVYITNNGSGLYPHFVDYILMPIGFWCIYPAYPAPSPTDSLKSNLDGTQARINIWRLLRERGLDYLGEEVPFVVFQDFWQLGMPFAHLGGIDESADQRAIYLKTYAMEMYAAGVKFCFPVIESEEEIAWWDSTSNGTALIEIIKQQTDFLNAYNEIYRDVSINSNEELVTVNGIVPFNGEWNLQDGKIICPVNESKVTISYMDKDDGTQSYLHIINHNWDDENHEMLPQTDVHVQIPVSDSCTQVCIISPEFADTIFVPYTYLGNTINFTIPSLEYYNVIILNWCTVSVEDEPDGNLPTKFILFQNYPNPFNPQTTISFSVPKESKVELSIFNLKGQKLRTLAKDSFKSGNHSIVWNGKDDSGKSVSSGIYFYKLNVNNVNGVSNQIRKCILMK